MDVWFTPHNMGLPVCSCCGEMLDRHGLKDKHGNFYHFNCYENKMLTTLLKIGKLADELIENTQGNNAFANNAARKIRSLCK